MSKHDAKHQHHIQRERPESPEAASADPVLPADVTHAVEEDPILRRGYRFSLIALMAAMIVMFLIALVDLIFGLFH